MARVALGPAPRIRWRTDADRAHEPTVARAVETFFACARGDETVLSAALDARLGALRRALVNSPFWLQRMRGHGISPRALESVADLEAFPPLSRAEVAAASGALIADPDASLVRVTSSGSTGTPVDVYRDAYDQLHTWACLRFWLAWRGLSVPRRPRAVLLCTLPSGLAYSRRAPLFHGGALHRISTARPDPVARLSRVRPSVIFTDPEGLAWLLARPPFLRPTLTLSSAQPLSEALAVAAEAHLEAPVLDYYATTETGPIAYACAFTRGVFHVLTPDVHVETEGSGALLVTRLREGPWPLVRYRTGDAGVLHDGACACGFVGRSIARLTARDAVRFARPDGEEIDPWRLAFLFKQRGVRDFCLTQRAPARFTLEVVGEPGEVIAELTAGLGALGWSAPTIALFRVEALAQGPKARPFVRDLEPRASPPADPPR